MKIDHIFDIGTSNEDSCLIKDNLFAVFDGYNSLDKFIDKDGVTGGLIGATIAKDIFSENEGTLTSLAIKANRKIRERMLDLKIDVKNKSNLWGTKFAAVRIKNNSFEWAQLSDSLILVMFKDNSYKLLVDDYDHDEEVLTLWKQLAEQKKENISKLIASGPLVELWAKANETYGDLNGEEAVINFIKSGEEKLQYIKHILLFTDGLIIPKEDPRGKDDWKLFVDLFLQGGLANVKDYVRKLEKDDPKCWKYPRYKQYDDISAISLSFQLQVCQHIWLLKIRKPDPTRPERGDADFTLRDYNSFKEKYLKDAEHFKLIDRGNFEMIELKDPKFDVRSYFSNIPLTVQLGIE